MEVILKRDFRKLGYKDDIINVKRGYGINYLIPMNIADFATDGNKKNAIENRKQGLKKIEKLREEAKAIATTLEAEPIEIVVKLSKEGLLLQKITLKMIIDALQQKVDHKFQQDDIILKNKIDGIGTYNVLVKICRGVFANMKMILKTE